MWLLAGEGLRGDLDQFVGWVHHIATRGLSTLYGPTDAGPVSFGPVMAYIWALLSAIQPGFETATDASDPAIRVIVKVPATLADFGIAGLVGFALRTKPRWAAVGVAAVMLHPVLFYVSSWWGQYESIYVLLAVAAVVVAVNGRNGVAAALVAAALMTKPQAIPFLLPFAAWFWSTGGVREVVRAALIGLAVIAVLWIPFLPFGGPLGYLDNVRGYSSGVFGILSLRAWNPWWIVQEIAASGDFILDGTPLVGPISLRHIGYGITAGLWVVLAVAIVRDPSPRRFVVALAASVLVFFTFMTQMHERYAYAGFVLLVLVLDLRPVRWLWVVFGIVLMLDLFAAAPATTLMQRVLPPSGAIAIIGSVILTIVTMTTALLAVRRALREPT